MTVKEQSAVRPAKHEYHSLIDMEIIRLYNKKRYENRKRPLRASGLFRRLI